MNNIDYKAVVEILENFLKNEKVEILGISVGEEYQLRQAIENLIQENKELKEKAKNTMGLIGANYIHKDKVKEKNKELNNKILNFINNELPDDEICECCSNYDVNGVRLKNELKKLLEGGE